jgi:hypothetical protein
MLSAGWGAIPIPQPELVLGALAGLLSATVALAVGRTVLGRRRPEGPPEVKEKPERERDPFVEGSACERRMSLRRSGKMVRVFLTDLEAQNKPLEAWVVDRSMGGLCLTTYDLFHVGDRLKVMVENAPPGTPWVEIEVKSVRPEDDRFELGCQFAKPPAWAILLLFG